MQHCLIGTLAGVSLAVTVVPAAADCAATLQAVLEGNEAHQEMSRSHVLTEQNGQVLVETNGWRIDYENFMFETVGRNWWSLTRGLKSFNSSDGKTWTVSVNQPAPDWVATSRQRSKQMRADLSDIACSTREEDGQTYQVFSYRHEAEDPMPTKAEYELLVDPATGRVMRQLTRFVLTEPVTTITTRYMYGETFELPTPE